MALGPLAVNREVPTSIAILRVKDLETGHPGINLEWLTVCMRAELSDTAGERVGTIVASAVDASGFPLFFVVSNGAYWKFNRKSYFVPAYGIKVVRSLVSTSDDDTTFYGLKVPFTKDLMENAPSAPLVSPVSADFIDTLCRHYSVALDSLGLLRCSSSESGGEVASESDEISAVVATSGIRSSLLRQYGQLDLVGWVTLISMLAGVAAVFLTIGVAL